MTQEARTVVVSPGWELGSRNADLPRPNSRPNVVRQEPAARTSRCEEWHGGNGTFRGPPLAKGNGNGRWWRKPPIPRHGLLHGDRMAVLTPRKVATYAGLLLIALELSDVAFVITVPRTASSHLLSFVLFFGLGGLLLWWGQKRPAPEATLPVPSAFWTVVAITLGVLLLVYGVFVGLVFSLVTSAGRAFLAFLEPWGLLGFGLIAYGGYRLAIGPARSAAAGRARALLSGILPESGVSPSRTEAGSTRDAELSALHQEVVVSVRDAYRETAPAIRALYWANYLTWTLAWVIFLGALTFGEFLAPPGSSNSVILALFLALAGLGVVEVGIGYPIRLRDLREADMRVSNGKVPDDWMLLWWVPYLFTARWILRTLGRWHRPPPETESSLLAASYSLLVYGRRLTRNARLWYLECFIILVLLGPFTAYVGLVVLGQRLAPAFGTAPLESLVALAGALLVLILAFAFLRWGYRRIDPLSERFATLESAEAELNREFWSRF